MVKRKCDNGLKELDRLADALFRGAVVMQTTPVLTSRGRTPAALKGTATGLLNIGMLGVAKNTAFGMLKAQQKDLRKKKRKGR